ncbi:MAG: DUF3244 domain-containing protein [Prevotella sp.]|nr:DUF3244 domain-containing protein [Prevotella sp.]
MIVLFMGISCFAQNQQVEEIPMGEVDPSEWHGPYKSPALLPHVFYGNQTLSILAPYSVDMMQIIIRDEDGDVIYSTFAALSSGLTPFMLPSSVCTSKYSVELIYGDRHLIGYF